MSAVTVYTKPDCYQCRATFRALDKAGIDYTAVDITLDSDARDYVMALGYLAAPSSWSTTAPTGPASATPASPHSPSPPPDSQKGHAAAVTHYGAPALLRPRLDRRPGRRRGHRAPRRRRERRT